MSLVPRVVAHISKSLNGFVTGPNAGPENGLGDGATRSASSCVYTARSRCCGA